jgi:aminoglycoside 3-N-acetyltransferase
MRKLGVRDGDTLFIHSSYTSLGPVGGGVETLISAFEQTIGPAGLLLMPSFNLVDAARRAETWDINVTPSTVGWISEYFRRMPETFRSDHYSHSVSAHGSGAREFVSGHLSDDGMDSPWDKAPWGKTYGANSPMFKAYRREGKLLMLGVDYNSSTYIHLIEVMYWDLRRRSNSDAKYQYLKRDELGEFWDRFGTCQIGRIGDADCRLFRINEYVDFLLAEVARNPGCYV